MLGPFSVFTKAAIFVVADQARNPVLLLSATAYVNRSL